MIKKIFPAIAWLLLAAMALNAEWTTKRLSANAGNSYWPCLAVSGSTAHAAWSDDSPGNFEIYYRMSPNKGASWYPAKRLSNNLGSSYQPVVAASGGNVYAAWSDDTPGNFDIYFRNSFDGGENWEDTKRLTNNSASSCMPSIAASGSTVYVAFHDNPTGKYEIYLRKSTNGGATWGAAQMVTDAPGDSELSSLALSAGNLYLAWENNAAGNNDIYFMKSIDGGATWKAAKRLTANSGNSGYAKLAVSGANVHVTWEDDTSGSGGNQEIYYRRSIDGGATWQSAKRFTNNNGQSRFPTIAVRSPQVFVMWNDSSIANEEILCNTSADNGATWSGIQRITNSSGNSAFAWVATNNTKVFVVYEDNTPGDFEIFFKSSPL